jgi:transposase
MGIMRHPIYIRSITETEREQLQAGLRSTDAFVLRRSQILLASSRGESAPQIAATLSCDKQTVLNAIHAFNKQGVAALAKGSTVPHTIHAAFTAETADRLRELLHRSPREFGKPTSLWTLDLAAEVAHEHGLTSHRVSGETIRATLARLGIRWLRAKHWLSSPDPAYARKKGDVIA